MTDDKPRATTPFNGRVLYVARAPFISGAERALVSTLKHLDRGRVQPHVVLGERTRLVKLIEQLDIPVTVMDMPKRSRGSVFGWWRSVSQLNAIVHRVKPGIIHANDVPSCQQVSVVGAQCHVPRVIHVRWGITAPAFGWWARKGAEAVVCISDWVRRQLGSLDNTPVAGASIEDIVDAVDWPAENVEKPAPRKRKKKQPPTIGFAGQLIEDKGLDQVITAMGMMDPTDRPRLLVAGEDRQTNGAYQRQLEALAAQCGVADLISWLGFLDDVNELYGQVDAMVCPSRVEPLGLVPLEAARCAIPTFATRGGGFKQTIEHNVTGVLVNDDPAAWAAALKQVQITAWLAELGEKAHDRTRAQYSPMVYQQRLMQLYARLASHQSRQASA